MLGDHGTVASRAGDDRLGAAARKHLEGLGLSHEYLQLDSDHDTGTAKVGVAHDGQPAFTISNPAAWDFLEWTAEWQQLARSADAVCFGSLAQRSQKSRETIRHFLEAMKPGAIRIFDVNLRQQFYSAEVLADSMKLAQIVKLNHEELPLVVKALGLPHADEMNSAQNLCRRYGIKLICITRGAQGSLLVSEDECHTHPGFRVVVADTIGAGDAFTAGLTYCYLRGTSLASMNEAANRLGSLVASHPGGTPPLDDTELQPARSSALGVHDRN